MINRINPVAKIFVRHIMVIVQKIGVSQIGQDRIKFQFFEICIPYHLCPFMTAVHTPVEGIFFFRISVGIILYVVKTALGIYIPVPAKIAYSQAIVHAQ